ncbi:iron transporter [Pseudoalteromonas sp. 1_2015MBL_MicDiv]|uniref:iron transporter n=1 Tax=Pseudoalteromonas sp. 1_2015MBL_MicDiv TaxID=1720343 RepID=UPI000BBF3684|nr:iron transporter [Pseudoalteromonas sp. 1_2015MBL_MicDiv]ATG79421.1 iron transporter [Pseudoalteromonas sp. 1_2015MBL_MicDiv]
MLITSLVMSLNQLLPVAILLVLLQVVKKQSALKIGSALVIGALMSFLYMQSASWVSQWFEHQGLEYSQIGLCITIFIAVLVFALKQKSAAFYIAVISTVTLYLSHYIIYLTSFWQNSDAGQSLFIGTLLGSGICLSFSVLLYFLMNAIKYRFGMYPLFTLLAFNSAAKLLVALDLASQIDLITNTATVWDLRDLLSENSELGRVLRALVGYEATPDLMSVLIYSTSSVLFLLLCYVIPASITKERV